jgi:ribonuclease-3
MTARPTRDEDDLLARCQRVLQYVFQDPGLLKSALTHASGADHRLGSNERLEFLGDAILGAVVCERLFRRFPDYLEGDLTRLKSHVVSRRICAVRSRALGLHEFLILGKGMGPQAQAPASVLADVFESLVGAIYLDGGFAAAQKFIIGQLDPEIDRAVEQQGIGNHKSEFQQVAQRQFGTTPTYLLLDEKGPDHSKCFKMAAVVGDQNYPPAWGATKKDAEQRAAQNALCVLAGEPAPFAAD